MRAAFLILLLCSSLTSISQTFVPPLVPNGLSNEHGIMDYFTLHYWDHYDFEDPYVFLEGDIMLEYFIHLNKVSDSVSYASITQTLEKASKSNLIFSLFIDTYRVYLLNPESLFCNYDRYLAVADFVLNNDLISQNKKRAFELEKKIICMNRIGAKATDFTVVDRNDTPFRLYDIESEYLLVYFQNPDCNICAETKDKLSKSSVINRMIDSGTLTVFTVCPYDEYEKWISTDYPEKWLNGYDKEQRINKELLYYFFESSTLYLLDKDKTILMKDAKLESIENYFSFQRRQH